jgi:hypothetical protein
MSLKEAGSRKQEAAKARGFRAETAGFKRPGSGFSYYLQEYI